MPSVTPVEMPMPTSNSAENPMKKPMPTLMPSVTPVGMPMPTSNSAENPMKMSTPTSKSTVKPKQKQTVTVKVTLTKINEFLHSLLNDGSQSAGAAAK